MSTQHELSHPLVKLGKLFNFSNSGEISPNMQCEIPPVLHIFFHFSPKKKNIFFSFIFSAPSTAIFVFFFSSFTRGKFFSFWHFFRWKLFTMLNTDAMELRRSGIYDIFNGQKLDFILKIVKKILPLSCAHSIAKRNRHKGGIFHTFTTRLLAFTIIQLEKILPIILFGDIFKLSTASHSFHSFFDEIFSLKS